MNLKTIIIVGGLAYVAYYLVRVRAAKKPALARDQPHAQQGMD